MACNQLKVYLGYEDEYVTEKNKYQVNYTTSKIGGKPDWPFFDKEPKNPVCSLCGLDQLLVVQIYAPLDNSGYHRTLYIFACINPNCWNQNESWTCLRSQCLDQSATSTVHNTSTTTCSKGISATEWIKDADDWGEGDEEDLDEMENNDNMNEENGNVITNNITITTGSGVCGGGGQQSSKSDLEDEDESCSMEDSLRLGLEELYVDSKNANNGKLLAEAQGGAVGRLQSPTASAEIEGEENEIVSIDTPTIPQRNLIALLQEVTPLPPGLLCQINNKDVMNKIEFSSAFLSIDEEDVNTINNYGSEHIKELINEYQLHNEDDFDFMTSQGADRGGGGGAEGDSSVEKYEQSAPIHGDRMFHYFITKIQQNPGQILRYSRGNLTPLLIAPMNDIPTRCKYCKSNMIFELQILPTIIHKLRLTSSSSSSSSTVGQTTSCSGGLLTSSQLNDSSSNVNSQAHVEFGNILIFTCDQSCWNYNDRDDGDTNLIREEVVIVQSERY